MPNAQKQVWFRAPPTDITRAKRRAKKEGLTLATVLKVLLSEYGTGGITFDDSAYRRVLQRGEQNA